MSRYSEDVEQVDWTAMPIGASKEDLETELALNEELFSSTFPRVKYFAWRRDLTEKDELYGEWVGGPVHDGIEVTDQNTGAPKTFGDYLLVPVKIDFGTQRHLLKTYGIEMEHLEAVAVFCNRISSQLGITPKTGDLIEFLGVSYEILTSKPLDFFLSSQVALNTACAIKPLMER